MSDNALQFTPTAGTQIAAADSTVELAGLPANPGIRIEQGSKGYIRFGGTASAFSFDVDCRQAAGSAFKLTGANSGFSICGGPAYYTVGTAEWVS